MADEQTCPKLAPVDESVLKLDYERKLKLVEEEAKSLYAFCLKKGFSDKEIEQCVGQLQGPKKRLLQKIINDSYRSVFLLAFIIGVATAVFMSPKATRLVTVHLKLASIKTIPYWDWTSLYNEECMVENPWLEKDEIVFDKRTCEYCTNVVKLGNNKIDRLTNATQDEITIHYINNQQPVIVTDTTRDWENKKKLDSDEIVKMYLYDQVLSVSLNNCNHTSNAGFNDTFYDFFNALNDGKIKGNYHANWENCEEKAGKIFRRYFTRPYFLPGMVQSGTLNKIIMSRGQHETWFQLAESGGMSAVWITVVEGSLEMILQPYQDCKDRFQCQDATITLNPGETVFFDDRAWFMEYRPIVEGVTIGIANPVVWDE